MRHILTLIAAGFLILSPVSQSLSESSYPQREVTFVIPWNAGGSNDVAARALEPLLREQGIKVIIENVVGATGIIGMRRVASAAPDGYTIGMGTSSTLAMIAQGKTPLKNEQFTNIARVSTDPLMLLVPTGSPHKTLEDFLGYMKKKPDQVSIGTPGSYNLNHIFALMNGSRPITRGASCVSMNAFATADGP